MEALPSFLGQKDVVVDVPGLGKVYIPQGYSRLISSETQLRSQWT